jgi:hypothetical protein
MTDARRAHAADGLATALLAGPWDATAMTDRARAALGRPRAPKWARTLVEQVLAAYREPPLDRPRELAAYLQTCPAWDLAWQSSRPPRVVHWTPAPTAITRARWPIAPLPDAGALCRLLNVDAAELAWFADVRGLERGSSEPLRHYRWWALPKGPGGAGVRVVAAPKPRLKEIQRRLLRHVLDPIPAHPAARGCVRGESVRSAVAPHVASTVVIRMDLEAFFASVTAARVWGVLFAAGLPETVAHTITGLCTTVVPAETWQAIPVPRDREAHRRLGRRLAAPHLPQGAPTSPALANLVAFTLDRRLTGLAERFGARYTRYVDDLTFSGSPSLRAARSRFVELATQIVRAEKFAVNERKTVVLGASGRQQVLGAVLNDHPTLPRRERDALRAIVHNCAVRGWQSQARGRPDFREHLLGRISWAAALDPVFGAKLRARFDAIDWS